MKTITLSEPEIIFLLDLLIGEERMALNNEKIIQLCSELIKKLK